MISIVSVVPHWPIVGVNVYVVLPIVEVFTNEGFHVPPIALIEVVCNICATEFSHWVDNVVNVGVIGLPVTVIVFVSVPLQPCPLSQV